MGEGPPDRPVGRKATFDDHPRFLGVIFLGLGLACGLLAFGFPIHEALVEGAAQVSRVSIGRGSCQ